MPGTNATAKVVKTELIYNGPSKFWRYVKGIPGQIASFFSRKTWSSSAMETADRADMDTLMAAGEDITSYEEDGFEDVRANNMVSERVYKKAFQSTLNTREKAGTPSSLEDIEEIGDELFGAEDPFWSEIKDSLDELGKRDPDKLSEDSAADDKKANQGMLEKDVEPEEHEALGYYDISYSLSNKLESYQHLAGKPKSDRAKEQMKFFKELNQKLARDREVRPDHREKDNLMESLLDFKMALDNQKVSSDSSQYTHLREGLAKAVSDPKALDWEHREETVRHLMDLTDAYLQHKLDSSIKKNAEGKVESVLALKGVLEREAKSLNPFEAQGEIKNGDRRRVSFDQFTKDLHDKIGRRERMSYNDYVIKRDAEKEKKTGLIGGAVK